MEKAQKLTDDAFAHILTVLAPSPVAGRLSIKVNELDRVKKGDILFSIDSPQIKAISHEIKILQSRLDVYRKLKTTNAEIAANLKVKTAEKKALLAGAEEKDGVVTVRATTEAMVEKLNTPDGAWVETGNAVISLVRTKALRFRSLAVSSEAAKLHDGMRAIVGGVDATIKLGIGEATGITPVFAVFDEKTILNKIVKIENILKDSIWQNTVRRISECFPEKKKR